MKTQLPGFLAATLLLLASPSAPAQQPLGTAFTYQGQLLRNLSPANGLYNFQFLLVDASNNCAIGTNCDPVMITNVPVSNGLFTVVIDFGPGPFYANSNFLRIAVETNGGSNFAPLLPLQPVTPTPGAIYALNAGAAAIAASASNWSGSVSGDVSGSQGAMVVTSVGGQTASNIASGVIAANAATSASKPNTVVLRDASGNFSGGSLTLSNSLNLPYPAIINAGGSPTLIDEGSFFAGGAGNTSLTGASDVGVGANALHSVTSGSYNTAVGEQALRWSMTGVYNTAEGYQALAGATNNNLGVFNTADGALAMQNISSGSSNTASGYSALSAATTGSLNVADGVYALHNCITGSFNTALGEATLNNTTDGNQNTAVGFQAMFNNVAGSFNTASGYQSLYSNISGSYNIALGYQAGFAVTSGISNIDIGSPGVYGDQDTIRIGTPGTQNNTFIAGIYNATSSGGAAVFVNSSGQLGTMTSSRRYKDNIQSMGDASDVLLSLRPVTFRYKPEIDPKGFPQFGLVAEEVDQLDPDLVVHDDQHGIYTVRYEAVNAMLLNEFLKQHRKLQEQTSEIQDLRQSVAELKALMKSLAEKK